MSYFFTYPQVVLAANKELQYEACAEFFNDIGQAYDNAEEKLNKYRVPCPVGNQLLSSSRG